MVNDTISNLNLKWYIYKLGHAGCRAARPKDCCATYSQLEHRLQIHLKRYIIELGHAGCRAALIEDCRATYSRLEHQLQIHLQVHLLQLKCANDLPIAGIC